jgi:tripartite-type tricarboxylate transporter receptor subunit TctC
MWSVRLVTVLSFLTVLVGGSVAAVPDYPVKPLRHVAASAPGGASDIIARTVGAALSEQFGVSVVVDNRPGAGSVVMRTALAASLAQFRAADIPLQQQESTLSQGFSEE